ncbi:CD109 antigen isoform X2 [Patella vulgata]|uniref:CD109 antigen isoform X2 n=1 Tax=Patella vulgata TaxID=6465 RepID=UPI0024A998C7|nr:CD109 antigen isoform X2 [Patella vulgata]
MLCLLSSLAELNISVLPRAEATVTLPSHIVITEQSVKVKVAGKYTHGKPLEGSATLRLKVDAFYTGYTYGRDPITNLYVRFPKKIQPILEYNLTLVNGEASVTLTLNELTAITDTSSLNSKTLVAQANVTDIETGTVYESKDAKSVFKSTREAIQFVMDPQNFKPGVNNSYYIEVLDHDGKPLVEDGNVTITAQYKTEDEIPTPLTTTPLPSTPYYGPWNFGKQAPCTLATYSWTNLTTQILILPPNGLLKFDIKVNDFSALELELKATYNDDYNVRASRTLGVTRSPSYTFISVHLLTLNPKVNEYADFEISSNIKFSQIHYFAMAKGQIEYVNTKGYYAAAKTQILPIRILPSFAPNVRVFVYFETTDSEIVIDAITFGVEGLFKNKVSIGFDKLKAEPKDQTTLSVKAQPYSNVYAVGVDKSITLLGDIEDEMSDEVEDFMNSLDTGTTPTYDNWRYWPMLRKKRSTVNRSSRRKRSYFNFPIFTPGTDVDEILNYNDINVITDAQIYKYVAEPLCYPNWTPPTVTSPTVRMYAESPVGPAPTSPPISTEPWEDTVKERSFFPETWIWEQKITSIDGFANFSLVVPDTISSWSAYAFAVHPSPSYGVGFTQDLASLEVYRDFFVTLNLPYSIIRGEEVLIQAIVFNYLNTDIQATVTLENPKGYVIRRLDANGYFMDSTEEEVRTIQILKDKTTSVYFAIKAVDLGSLDIQVYAKSSDHQAGDRLIKPLLVEAEGVPSEYSETMLINLVGDSSQTVEQTLTLSFPNNCIDGSKRIQLTAYGDTMAGTLFNLGLLIRMPYGCGEQNIVTFVPNIYARKYIDAVGTLDAQTKSDTELYMRTGYSRELNYRNRDGSYCPYSGYGSGSQWLTAYVLQSFVAAKQYIYVDDEVLRSAARALIDNQNSNGSFTERGRVTFRSSFGESTNGIALTAFIVIALSEANNVAGINATATISKAVNTLSTESLNMTNVFDLAITAYSFVTSDNLSLLDDIMAKLESLKTTDGDTAFWEVKPPKKVHSLWHLKKYNAASVECTAYVLLVYAHKKDLVKGIPVMNWLIKQRSGIGGYRNSRDTVVAVHALSEFAPLLKDVPLDAALTVTACKDIHNWSFTKPNAMIQRKAVLKETSETINVQATGQGRMYLTALVKCNVEDIEATTAFLARVQILEETSALLKLQVCAEYTVNGSSSGMAIMEVGIVSGFTLDSSNLATQTEIKRFELGFRNVILYFDQITNNSTCVEIHLIRSDKVGKVKPAFVKVYDYYDSDNSVTVFYQAVMASQMEVCDSCTANCDICIELQRRRR